MVTTKVICLEQIVWIWDDKMQTHFNSIETKCEVKCKWRWPCGGYHYILTHGGEFDLHDHHKVKFELCSWSAESIHANTTKATFGWSETQTKVHKTHFAMWIFMKLIASYKYIDTWMLIGLTMFQIGDQLVVSCFLLEVVLLVGIVRNNQQLHHQVWRLRT